MRKKLIAQGRAGAAAALLVAASFAAVAQEHVPDATLQAEAQKQLHGKSFREVQVRTADGVITLTGQVKLLADELEAGKKIEHTHDAASVNNQITVATADGISDAEIFARLGKKLAFDRQGYGTLAFNSITLNVRNGIVTLGGEVVLPVDKESAVDLVTTQPGVQGLVDHLQVAPLSPNDNRIRQAEFQAIYGTPQLTRYAIDPGKPIRIIVNNGNVTLVGVVDSTGDRDIAGIRANAVPGVFSVKNELQVAGQSPERHESH